MDAFPQVYISLTSIPSRTIRTLENTLKYLEKQEYDNIQNIIVTLPTVNKRGQKTLDKLPEYLYTSSKIVVHRPNFDLGPIMKYVGVAGFMKEDSWVWVCDDDQLYSTTAVKDCIRMLNKIHPSRRNKTVVTLRGGFMFFQTKVQGFSGVLLPYSAIKTIETELSKNKYPKCCFQVDDDLISYILKSKGYKIVDCKYKQSQFLDKLENGKEVFESEDALHSVSRKKNIFFCTLKLNPSILLLIYITVILLFSTILFLVYKFQHTHTIQRTNKTRVF